MLARFRDRHGALWFGTNFGLSRFIPEPEKPHPPPPVLVSSLRIAGVEYQVSELGVADVTVPALGPHQNQMQIDYFGVGFAPGEALRFHINSKAQSVNGVSRRISRRSIIRIFRLAATASWCAPSAPAAW